MNAPVKDKQGLLTSEKEQEERWTENFKEVLNRPDPETTVNIPEAVEDIDMCTDVPSKRKYRRPLKVSRTTMH